MIPDKSFSEMALPNGPESTPIHQMQAWVENPIEFWENCNRQYGDVFTVQLGSLGSIVLFSHPEAVRKIFTLSPHLFECRQYNEQYRSIMGDLSLLVQDGKRHQRQRRLLVPPFHREQVQIHAQLICDITREVTERFPIDSSVNLRPFMHEIALLAILKMVFGVCECQASQQIYQIFKSQILQDLGSWSPWARFGRLQPQIRQIIDTEIQYRREQLDPNSPDILNLFLLARDEEDQPLSHAEIQDHIFTLLIAGVDPVALSITWGLYWIHQLPDVRQTLLEELGELGDRENPMKVAQLPYLTATCKEILRMYPVVTTPSGRKLTEPVEIMGRRFAAGITLVPCTYLVHRREDIYPEPNAFKPERFLDRQFTPYEYFPFGGGNRLCIGSALAQLEIKLVLAAILSDYHLTLSCRGPVRPARHGTLLTPSNNLEFIIRTTKVKRQ